MSSRSFLLGIEVMCVGLCFVVLISEVLDLIFQCSMPALGFDRTGLSSGEHAEDSPDIL